MNEKRKGEIAILVVKAKMKESGWEFIPNFDKKVALIAALIGVSLEELKEFFFEVASEILMDELGPVSP